MESRCHVGRVCIFELEGGVEIAKHGMQVVLDVIEGEKLPVCLVDESCRDCANWTFVDDDVTYSEL